LHDRSDVLALVHVLALVDVLALDDALMCTPCMFRICRPAIRRAVPEVFRSIPTPQSMKIIIPKREWLDRLKIAAK